MTRKYYSKIFKQQALFEVANGEKLELVLRKNGYDIDDALKKDKKYCSKLLYKWRKELQESKITKNLNTLEDTACIINQEINNLDDDKKDIIMSDMTSKIFLGINKYKNLKTRIMSSLGKKNQKNKK